MTYFKVMRWRGGEGGDVLLHSLLISNPQIKSNVVVEKTFLNNVGRITTPSDESMPNLYKIINNVEQVDSISLQIDLERLKSQGNWLLKSHYYNNSFDTITIIPTEETYPFFFAARYSKIPLRNLAANEERIKLLIKNKNEFIEYDKNYIRSRLVTDSKNTEVLYIDDILSKNYNVLEEKLQLKIDLSGRNFIDKWFERQKELFPNELVKFR